MLLKTYNIRHKYKYSLVIKAIKKHLHTENLIVSTIRLFSVCLGFFLQSFYMEQLPYMSLWMICYIIMNLADRNTVRAAVTERNNHLLNNPNQEFNSVAVLTLYTWQTRVHFVIFLLTNFIHRHDRSTVVFRLGGQGGRDLRADLMREGFRLAAVKSLAALMQIMHSSQISTHPQCPRGQSQHTLAQFQQPDD